MNTEQGTAEVTIVAVGANAWGKGSNPAAAQRRWRKNLATYVRGAVEFTLYEVRGFACVDELGRIHYRQPDGRVRALGTKTLTIR